MKKFHPTLPQESYKVGEELLLQTWNRQTRSNDTVTGKVLSNTGITMDGIPFIEVETSGSVKKYATNQQ